MVTKFREKNFSYSQYGRKLKLFFPFLKVYNAKTGSKESKGPFGLMETVREKIDTVRGRRRSSKEPTDRPEQVGQAHFNFAGQSFTAF